MKSCLLIALLIATTLNLAQEQSKTYEPYRRWTKAQKYAKGEFYPVDCFAGQVKVRGKRIVNERYSVFEAKEGSTCCGKLVRTSKTDAHGHFFLEPLSEGEYFARFDFKGEKHVLKFAIIDSYRRCEGDSHIEIDFAEGTKRAIQSFADIDDSGEPCQPNEPRCFRQ